MPHTRRLPARTSHLVAALCRVGAIAALAMAALSAVVAPAGAQGSARAAARRSTLDSLAIASERSAADARVSADERARLTAEARALRTRLTEGDYQAGDRVVLRVPSDSTLSDTFTVTPKREILLPDMAPLPLAGVLRSELPDVMRTHLGRYLVDPRVDVTSLLRVSVVGRVTRPGFYALPVDALLSDAIMTAGGPAPDGDLSRVTVRRNDDELWTRGTVRNAIAAGQTLDQLHLRGGDAIVVGRETQRNWPVLLQSVAMVAGIAAGVYAAATR